MAVNQHSSKSQHWKMYIDTWRSSGKSMNQWCQEHNISKSTMGYWKNKFSCEKLDKNFFIEVAEEPSTGITIKCKELEIHIDKAFDEQTLYRCLKVIRSSQC